MLVNIIQNTISSFRSALAAASVITTNLKMWLGFETSSIDGDSQITPDKSGNNNVGELFTGKALEFDGVTSYITADGFAGTLIDDTAFSIVMWFKSNQVSQAQPYQNIQMSGLKSDGSSNVFKFGASANSTLKGIHYQDTAGASNNYKINDTVNYNDNVWHRLVITRRSGTNPQTANFYVDGVSIGNCPSQIVWADLSKFSIGQEYDGGNTPSDFFKGLISDVQIYDKDWLQADVTFDYANPNILVTDSANTGTAIFLTNLKGYWAMSEGAGSLVYDSSGEGNNGTIIGATYEPNQPRIPQLGMQNWSKGSNLLKYSEDFSQNIWTKNNLTQTYGFTSPTGILNATKLTRTNTNSHIESTVNITTVQYNTASIYVKGVSGTIGEDVRLYVYNGTSLSSELFTLTGDWQRITHSNSSASGQSFIKIKLDVPNVTNGEVLVWGGQLEQSSLASAYRLTDGADTSISTVIANPTIPTKDILGNLVRDRLNSFNLDGSGYAEVADDTDLDFGTGEFTLECWAKYDFLDQGSGFNVIVSNGNISASGGSGFNLASKSSSFSIRLNPGNQTVDFGSGLTQGQWYHIVVTRSGTTLKTYLDKSDTTNTKSSVNVNTSLPVRIGRDTNSDRFYQNLISDVRLYDRALSATEVENNYNAGLSAHTN